MSQTDPTQLPGSPSLTDELTPSEIAMRRDEILSAVGFASNALLKSANWKDALDSTLQRLGSAARANRAYFFENRIDEEGIVFTSQVAEWVAAGVEPQIDNPDLQMFPFVEAGMGRWVEVMNQRQPIHGLICDFPESERIVLEAQGIVSLVAMPVFSDDRLAGFLGFDDCESLRSWSTAEFDALFAAAGAIGAAIDRQRLENQLRFAQKMEAVGSLATGVAHDFNNMLQAIVGFANIVKLKVDDDHSAQQDLDEILAASDRANSLTKQLLSFSRKQEFEPTNASLGTICDSVATMIKPMLGRSIELSIDVSDPAPIIYADADTFTQVLLNLCLNARDAMPQGGKLEISCYQTQLDDDTPGLPAGIEPGPFACLVVSDDGIGMSDAVQERVFEPFFTTKAVGNGTGLGLSVAYGTIAQCGGFVELKSAPNKGTRFKIYVPIAPTTSQADSSPQSEAGNETVLLVDDEPQILESTQELLVTAGYEVLTATNGIEGLLTYKQHASRISLILCDAVMPFMDGVRMIESILDLNAHAKAILISGYNSDSSVRLQKSSSVISLQKPARHETLNRAIRQLIDA